MAFSSSPQIDLNDRLIALGEHWDPFFKDAQKSMPKVWIDRIKKGTFDNFKGVAQSSTYYRGGLPMQAGLGNWHAVRTSATDGEGGLLYDSCLPDTPSTYDFTMETLTYSGYSTSFQSPNFCVNDLKYKDFAQQQLAAIIKTGVEYGRSIQETFNREMYVHFASRVGRSAILTDGALGFVNDPSKRFVYDPFATTANANGEQVPYIEFDASLKVSTLNWEYLDYLRSDLAMRTGTAALSTINGSPVFGLMISLPDFEKYVKSDPELREDWRHAEPRALIDNYPAAFKQYRSWAIMEDMAQMRFQPQGITTDGKVRALRVLPLRLSAACTGGDDTMGRRVEPNPEYALAELAIGVVFLNDVFTNLFEKPVTTLGSGTSFGTGVGYDGAWQWLNIQDAVTNPLKEHGFFFGRYCIHPRPGDNVMNATVFLYRRCTQVLSTNCSLEIKAAKDTTGGGVIESVDETAIAARKLTIVLNKPISAGLCDRISIAVDNSNTITAYVAETKDAPTYVICWDEDTTVAAGDIAAGMTVTAL